MSFHVVPSILLSYEPLLPQILPFLVSSVNLIVPYYFISYCEVLIESLGLIYVVSGDGVWVVDLSRVNVSLELPDSLPQSVLLYFLLILQGCLHVALLKCWIEK